MTDFFSKFPQRNYGFVGTTLGIKQVVDITRRVVLRSYAKNNASLFIRYKIKDSESYEDIADRLYGSPKYHWILMLLNEVIDPFTDMPQRDYVLNKIIDKNYTGYSLFMKVIEYDGNFVVGETVTANTASVDSVTGNIILNPSGYTATVKEWDPNYRELVVESETNTSTLQTDMVILGSVSESSGTFKRRVLHKEAVHHFEDESGNFLNPVLDFIGEEMISPLTSYTESSVLSGVNTVTNKEYEETKNDMTRNIKVMRPENVSQVVAELESLMRN